MLDANHDQARGMRRLFARRVVPLVSITGTAGTTALTLDLAAALAHAGRRVLILDRSCGEAATGLGLKARFDFAHVVSLEKSLDDVLKQSATGVAVLPAARALDAIDAGDSAVQRALCNLLAAVHARFDICLVNGMAPAAQGMAHDVLLVTAPGGAAIQQAYAQVKALAGHAAPCRLRIVVNRAHSDAAAMSVYSSLAATARRFLAARLDYGGHLPSDAVVRSPRPGNERLRTPRAHALACLAELLASDATTHYAPV